MPWRDVGKEFSPNFRLVKISGNRYRIGIFYLDNAALKVLCFQAFAAQIGFGTVLATVFASGSQRRSGQAEKRLSPRGDSQLGGVVL